MFERMSERVSERVSERAPELTAHGITGILLAAGFSTRFGGDKLMSEINGRALIEYSAAALAPCDRIVAVTRDDNQALLARLHALDIACVINPEPARGMGYSIARGVKATADSAGWCILPADMPFVSATTTARIVSALSNGAQLAAPVCQNRRGHPVGFNKCFAGDLAALDGDHGARSILSRHTGQLRLIPSEDAGVIYDIDMPSALRQDLPVRPLA